MESLERKKAPGLVQIKVNRGVEIRVLMEGYPEFIYPQTQLYGAGSRDLNRYLLWVGKPLADFLVENGYATLV